ncbi:MAG: hypothetical protein ACR2JG_09375 [Geodermatophilaceae bacterium]
MTSFQDSQIAALAASGWAQCPSVADAVTGSGLPPVTASYLQEAFTAEQWHAAEVAVSALRDRFSAARFADEVTYGTVLVPDPDQLDTRGPMDPAVRRDQLRSATADVVDPRLPAGRLGVPPGAAWTLVATVTGPYGPALGSYTEVTGADADQFAIDDVDVRELMIRQMWGARVLQNGASLPDCEANDRWTFTLFPGEGLTDGLAASGTVLKEKVRFRLGKPNRGISSARVAPAIAVR